MGVIGPIGPISPILRETGPCPLTSGLYFNHIPSFVLHRRNPPELSIYPNHTPGAWTGLVIRWSVGQGPGIGGRDRSYGSYRSYESHQSHRSHPDLRTLNPEPSLPLLLIREGHEGDGFPLGFRGEAHGHFKVGVSASWTSCPPGIKLFLLRPLSGQMRLMSPMRPISPIVPPPERRLFRRAFTRKKMAVPAIVGR